MQVEGRERGTFDGALSTSHAAQEGDGHAVPGLWQWAPPVAMNTASGQHPSQTTAQQPATPHAAACQAGICSVSASRHSARQPECSSAASVQRLRTRRHMPFPRPTWMAHLPLLLLLISALQPHTAAAQALAPESQEQAKVKEALLAIPAGWDFDDRGQWLPAMQVLKWEGDPCADRWRGVTHH